jgi:hypothetical protein
MKAPHSFKAAKAISVQQVFHHYNPNSSTRVKNAIFSVMNPKL